jgi:probable phosphoglycerate mutase
MLQVYLVRHGETQWNAERRIQGQSDSPLTAHGERQAWQVGERARTLGIWGEPAAQQKLSPKPAAAA